MKISVSGKLSGAKDFTEIKFNNDILDSRLVVGQSGKKILEIKPIAFENASRRHLVIIARQIIMMAKRNGIKKISLSWQELRKLKLKNKPEEITEIMAVNFEMANYEFTRYKTPPKEGWPNIEEAVILADREMISSLKKALAKGQLLGLEINASRDLSNTPGGEMTPALMANEIKKAIKGTGIKMKVLEVADMKKLGMGAILGVAHGSCEKPKFIILEYVGKKDKNPIVLAGKAVTFDTGGLNLKPSDSIMDMHLDMSGGAAVAFAIIAAAKLGIKKRIIGLIPAAENMPSGESYRPGDILKSMSGKTIEVLNTDAEGRILLADAFTFAEKYNPKIVIDVATLTGAAAGALGERASAIFSKDEDLVRQFQDLGERSGDYVWPLPLWDEYEPEVKGINADVANLKSQGNPRYGGAINGAMFLYQFAKKFPRWIHIDMAPRDKAVYDEFLAKGSTGEPIRLLVKLLEEYK